MQADLKLTTELIRFSSVERQFPDVIDGQRSRFLVRLLLIEDHRAMRDLITDHLKRRGFTVDAIACGEEALAAAAVASYDAMILDLGLPDMDGMEVLRQLRSGGRATLPTLILTARDGIEARVNGLDAGADDYILKPFDFSELEARLRAVLRRSDARRELIYCYGDLTFDPVSRTATVASARLDLPRREACLLEELIRADGRIVVRDALEDQLYGFDDDVSSNALEASVSRLRRRLVTAGSVVTVEVARGIGYRLHIETRP